MEKAENISSRRNFLGNALTAATAMGITLTPVSAISQVPGKNKEAILDPTNPYLPIFNILSYGASGNGTFLNTQAIQQAVNECAEKGGGIVFIPPGDFLTGSIQLKSNVNLHISAGAKLTASTKALDYFPEDPSLIFAIDGININITGQGIIEGNGSAFWKKENNRWIVGDWRPNRVISFLRCVNILLESITIQNSPSWTIQPVDCSRVTIRGIKILNGIYEDDGPNTDGIDPDGCSMVHISDCLLQCGDDAIVLKITDRPGGNKISHDITVINCIIQTMETALKIGSESFGEFRNITFSNCTIHDSGCGIGLWMRDGGLIDGMVVSNIVMDTTRLKNGGQPIYIWSHRRTDQTSWGTIRNILITGMIVTGQGAIFISGPKEKSIEGLTLDNIRITVQAGRETTFNENPPDPFTPWGHHRAPFDIFCRYIDGLQLRNIHLTWSRPEKIEWGGAIRCWNVNNLEIAGFIGRQSLPSSTAVFWFKNVKQAFIYNCRVLEGANTLFKLEEDIAGISIMGNEFSSAKRMFEKNKSKFPNKIFQSGNHLPADL